MNSSDRVRQTQALQMREEIYNEMCKDAGISGLRSFVKENEHNPFYPNTLPPKAEMRRPSPGDTTGSQDSINYLNALVTEADRLADLCPRLEARMRIPRNLNSYKMGLEYARCLVRIVEMSVDWELAAIGNQHSIMEAKKILREGYMPGGLTESELQTLRDEVKIWDEWFPAAKAALERRQSRNSA
ncbi:hypothetical protein F4781DRAFT_411473 [Annulohypoxylon bovei var. microspora]|nr:hypothetical protein F4781DRAFT_411473 [Annulohypoxylon bovei var. microspora]